MTYSKLSLFLTNIISFGICIFFVCAAHAEHFNKRPEGKHGPGPGQNELIIKKSVNEYFTNSGEVLVQGAHVPNLVQLGSKLFLYYQWFPKDKSRERWFDHIGVSTSDNSGSAWKDAVGVKIVGIPQRLIGRQGRPMDPAAIALSNDQIRLFFTLEKYQPHNRVIGDAKIHSALSHDGINFKFESGPRFQIEGVDLRDPAIAYFKDTWHLYAPNQKQNGIGYYATSTDGLKFVRQPNVSVRERGDWLGNATTSKGKIYFFGTMWVATSTDGSNWISKRSKGLGPDPAVIYLENGNWLGITFRRMDLSG